ncbi:MAG: DM13 domain-containing protein [Pseudomonadota bacterium]
MTIAFNVRRAAPIAAPIVALGLMLAATPTAMSAELLKQGAFVGQSKHITTGTATIQKDGDSVVLVLGSNFSLDGAPDPTVGFTKNGKFIPASQVGELKMLNGKQTYTLPKGFLAQAYDAVTIWCRKFAVPLGTAKLS